MLDLFRGVSGRGLLEGFLKKGGTELAPMSTTTDLAVAVAYSAPKPGSSSVLFKLRTANFMDRGGSIAFLSAFPGEAEYLFPALTFLKPTGRREDLTVGDVAFTVVEVEARINTS